LSSIDGAKRKIPLAIFVGTADPFFPLKVVRFTRDALERAAMPVTLKEIPGHDHDYYTWSAEINRDAWAFLRDKQLPAEPQYEQQKFVQ
jgi:dienelactone hydrolase